jgi:hypothetical protein
LFHSLGIASQTGRSRRIWKIFKQLSIKIKVYSVSNYYFIQLSNI